MRQLSLCATTTEPSHPSACAARDALAPQLESNPSSPQLEIAHMQQWRAYMLQQTPGTTKMIIMMYSKKETLTTWILNKWVRKDDWKGKVGVGAEG